jgi:hypothetical protein
MGPFQCLTRLELKPVHSLLPRGRGHHSGVVQQHVAARVFCQELTSEQTNRRQVCQVQLHHLHGAALLRNLFRDCGAFLEVPACTHNSEAFTRQL